MTTTAFSQREIRGQVSGEAGEALPGVNVIVKGTASGTVTDIEGKFSLNATEDAETLVFSFIGYITQEVDLGNRNTINVELLTDSQQLSEVVVTALGIKREERSLGYSVQELNTQGLAEARET
ncbi:MAG: carboxypeptidase-like regulatory domain-containing protein, partial [Cyclobacteriaceae bacterium]